jgi:O-antigen/teichoic acid export membrane protein
VETVFLKQRARVLLGRLDRALSGASPLVVGRLVAAALTFAVPLVLARHLSREQFGTYKQFFLVAMTLTLTGQMGLTQSLYYFLPRGGPDRGAFVTQSIMGLCAVGALAALLVLVLPFAGPHRVPLALFSAAALATTPLEATLTSQGRTGLSAAVYVLFEFLRGAALLTGALLSGLRGCIWGATFVMLFRFMLVIALHIQGWLPHGRPTRATWRRQIAYALPYAGSAVLYVVQRNLGQYVVSVQADAATFALFSVAMFHLMTTDMVYTPVSEVLIVRLGRAAAGADWRGAREAFHDATLRLAELFFPMAALMWVLGGVLVPTLFSRKYVGSVPTFFVLTLEIPVGVLLLDAVMRAAAETRFLFRVNALRVVMTFVLVVVGVRVGGLPGAALGTVVSELFGRLLMLGRARRFLHTSLRESLPWRALARLAGRSAVPFLPAWATVRLLDGMPRLALALGTLIYGAGFAMCYIYTAAWRSKPSSVGGTSSGTVAESRSSPSSR